MFHVYPGTASNENNHESKKRPLSIVSQIEVSSTQRKARPSCLVDLSSENEAPTVSQAPTAPKQAPAAPTQAPFTQNPLNNRNNNTLETENVSPDPSESPDVIPVEDNPQCDFATALLSEEKSVTQMLELAKTGYFPRRLFNIKGVKKLYTAITHFFHCKDNFESLGESTEFKCKINNCIFHCNLGDLTNLNKHLKTHPETAKWYRSYIYATRKRKTFLSFAMLNLIKFFISSYQSLALLDNEHFKNLIRPTINVPSYFIFRNSMLPEVMLNLHDVIEEKLNNAAYICLIPDIWEYDFNNYLGLAATICSHSGETQVVVLGIRKIPGSSAEEIKALVEEIINCYIFEYKKVKGNTYFSDASIKFF